MNHLKTKPNMLQQDFHRGSNPAYDKVAFVADHYDELVFMYKDILEHLKQGTSTGTDTHLTKTFEDTYGFVQLDKEAFKGWGYDLDNPTDVQFLINGTFILKSPDISNNDRVYYIEYLDKFTVPTKECKVIHSRGMDDFFEKMPTIANDWNVEITVEGVAVVRNIYGYDYNTEDNFLKKLYQQFQSINFSSPMTVKIWPYNNSTDENTFTYTSDTVENNPLYLVSYPAGFATINNVLVFPKGGPGKYKNNVYLYMHQGTTNRLDRLDIYGVGEIISTYISDFTGLSLSASSSKILYNITETDKYTFTHTIDSALRNN